MAALAGAVGGAPLLEARGLVRSFGGVLAVDGVDLALARGEVRAVIGPNGAGKTTLVGLICGRLRAGRGTVRLDGRDITRLAAWRRALAGIVYTFQVTSVYPSLTCYANVALAAQRRLLGGSRLRVDESEVARRVDEALAAIGLESERDRRADELAYGHRRMLEIAMALALEPRLLILDEPTQGLAERDIARLCDHVRAIAARATVLLIEHNMPVVLDLAHRITVMDQGRVIAEGEPAEVERDPVVQRAYLGR